MLREKNLYFILDGKNIPIECSKKVWEVAILGKRHLFTDKVDHKKVVTSFISRHLGKRLPHMFKTSVYDSRNHLVYIEFYSDYDNAVKGHRRIVEEHK